MATSTQALPRAFIWRRIHSLMGLWLVIFLVEHMLTNSQAALWLGDNGKGFVRMVNWLHNLPYLQVIEGVLLGVPILIHGIWGVKYALTAKSNARSSDGSKPALAGYGRNRAYSWQRITSWILLVGLIAHVVKFRFLEYPVTANSGAGPSYFIAVKLDDGLYTVADRLDVALYSPAAILQEVERIEERKEEIIALEAVQAMLATGDPREGDIYSEQKALLLSSAQKFEQRLAWVEALTSISLDPGEVVAVSKDFGTATLLAVRDVFKSPLHVGLYTLFVLAACFHAFNGLWTFLISWGWILRMSAQRSMVLFCVAVMAVIAFLGLAAVWGTYWINLRY